MSEIRENILKVFASNVYLFKVFICLVHKKYTNHYHFIERNFIMKQLFFILIDFVASRAARDVCLDDFYSVGNTECFEMSFPWVTFPEKYWPMIRVFSEPLPLNEINITLHIYKESDFIQISNKTEFEKFYNQEQVRHALRIDYAA